MSYTPAGPSLLRGWPLFWIAAAAIAAATAGLLAVARDYDGIRSALQLTARTSFALFMIAFTASSLARLFPHPATAWLAANRRYFGLTFAASHAIHLFVIVGWWDEGIGAYTRSQPYVGFVANVIGYIVIAAMAVTSFGPPRRWLGQSAWSWLHTIGGYYIWLSFAKSFLPRAFIMPEYWAFVIVLVAALALRFAARYKARGTARA